MLLMGIATGNASTVTPTPALLIDTSVLIKWFHGDGETS